MAAASVRVEQKENDFGATLLVTVAGAVTAHVLESLWDDFVRPRLRRRFKRDARGRLRDARHAGSGGLAGG